MHPLLRWILGSLASAVALAALLQAGGCGRPAARPPVPAAPGAPASAALPVFARAGCGGCHTVPGVPNAVGLVGPNLALIGVEGGTRKPGMSARDYIRESILNPNAFIAPKCPNGACPPNVMPQNFGKRLSPADIERLVDYLAGLKGEAASGQQAPATTPQPIAVVRPPETAAPTFAPPPRKFKDAEVLLGKYLFFDSRLSADASSSCATCHVPDKAWTDGKALSDGYPGTRYFRNTPTLLNTVFTTYAYWDGRLDATDMAAVVRDHITEAHFFQADGRLVVERLKQVPEYVQLFQDAYGKKPGFGGMVDAVSAYVLSLNSGPSTYDRYRDGDKKALSVEAQAGMQLFRGKAGCARCHAGPAFTDNRFHALGVPENPDILKDPLRHFTFRRFFRTLGLPAYRHAFQDVGRYASTLDLADRFAFRTAPLREVARTAPYMHNGVFRTLTDVVRFYNAGGGKGNTTLQPLGLTDSEVAQIVAFLESLSSEPIAVVPPQVPGYQVRRLGDNR